MTIPKSPKGYLMAAVTERATAGKIGPGHEFMTLCALDALTAQQADFIKMIEELTDIILKSRC